MNGGKQNLVTISGGLNGVSGGSGKGSRCESEPKKADPGMTDFAL
jgi:hypothetical protein